MGTWVILASGRSLADDDVQYVKAHRESGSVSGVIAVSNVALDKAPWADAIVSHDSNWWRAHPQALKLNMRRFCRQNIPGCTVYVPRPMGGCNSGYMAMQVACNVFKATKLVLLGFDMHGDHYFGAHGGRLKNTDTKGFRIHIRQFDSWNGCQVINSTPNSALKKFPFIPLEKAL